jgi:DNA-binding response OmpR family regulator
MAKIVVIDDDLEVVEMLRSRLAEHGHTVFAAMDANGGMMVAGREKPDLITLDYKMPAGDGALVLSRLRSNNFTAKTPIIFISGVDPSELDPSMAEAAGTRFLPKPIDLDRLLKLIKDLLADPFSLPPPMSAPNSQKPALGTGPLEPPKKPKAPPKGEQPWGGDILDLDV